jgi:hypothetical protein
LCICGFLIGEFQFELQLSASAMHEWSHTMACMLVWSLVLLTWWKRFWHAVSRYSWERIQMVQIEIGDQYPLFCLIIAVAGCSKLRLAVTP